MKRELSSEQLSDLRLRRSTLRKASGFPAFLFLSEATPLRRGAASPLDFKKHAHGQAQPDRTVLWPSREKRFTYPAFRFTIQTK
jgi:hypothetical protein